MKGALVKHQDVLFFYFGAAAGLGLFIAIVAFAGYSLNNSRGSQYALASPVPLTEVSEGRVGDSFEAILAPPVYPQRDLAYPEPSVTAAAVVVFDAQTGNILFAKDAQSPHKIASLTKLFTALTVLENLAPDAQITLTAKDVAAYGEAGGFSTGEKFTVADLTKALLIQSSNDAAEALASAVPQFTARVEGLIERLNLKNTLIHTATGLDGGDNHASAADLMTLMLNSLSNGELWHVLSLNGATVYDIATKKPHHLITTNKLLGQHGIRAGKTGFTLEAKETYLAMFNGPLGRNLGLVILGSDDRFADAADLINWVQTAYQW